MGTYKPKHSEKYWQILNSIWVFVRESDPQKEKCLNYLLRAYLQGSVQNKNLVPQ